MARPFSDREREVLIGRGAATGDERRADARRRSIWQQQVELTRAGRPRGCGTCPSIELEGIDGPVSDFIERIMLEGWVEEAGLLLFVEDDRFRYLAPYPIDDREFDVFSPTEMLQFSDCTRRGRGGHTAARDEFPQVRERNPNRRGRTQWD